jgi:hypothetical protein
MKKLCLYLKINPPNNALRHLYALYWLATNPPLEAFLQEPFPELFTHAVGGTCCATGGRFMAEIKWTYKSKPASHSDISALSESGRSTPSRQALIEIAQGLDVPLPQVSSLMEIPQGNTPEGWKALPRVPQLGCSPTRPRGEVTPSAVFRLSLR